MKTLGEGWWGFQLVTPSELTNHFHGGRNPLSDDILTSRSDSWMVFFSHYKDGAGSIPAGGNY